MGRARRARARRGLSGGAVLAADDPLAALQRLATAWRRELDAAVIGVTGSVGKTSTKQLIAALIAPHRRVAANPANFNTEIGLPLAVLAAPEGTEVLVLEMGMRGFGQIDELARIAEPDVGVITNIGPVHLELVGSSQGVARAKAELLAHVPVAIVPADVPELEPYLREDLDVVRFGTDVMLEDFDPPHVTILARELRVELEVPFTVAPPAREPARGGRRRAGGRRGARGPRRRAASGRCAASTSRCRRGVVVINDCYNANPLSMRAALDDLATQAPHGAACRRARRHARARRRARPRRTARSAPTRPRPALTSWSPSGRSRPLMPDDLRRRGARRRGRARGGRARRASSCGRATSCS